MVSIYGGSGGGGFDYVQDGQPADAEEGEEWYDTGANAAFVYDGADWIEETVVDHGQLSGVDTSDHHSRPTGTDTAGISGGYTKNEGDGLGGVADGIRLSSNDGNCINNYSTNFTVQFADGSSQSYYGISGTVTRNFSQGVVTGVSKSSSSCVNDTYNLHMVTLSNHSHGV